MPSNSRNSAQAISDRRIVGVQPERVTDVSSTDFPGHYPGEDNSWDLRAFKQNLQVKVTRLSQRSVEFDLVGVDASIANAFRRIMIAEVPTICIEDVFVTDNTSVIQDEVLAHRIGLVPLNIDPEPFLFREPGGQPTDRNTVVFKLNVTCTRKMKQDEAEKKGITDDNLIYDRWQVLSGDLVWVPQGEQAELHAFKIRPPGPTNPNIVLAKLRPGQSVEMELHGVKGVGKDHAKFSPVATASYRLMPHITLNPEKPVPPEHAEKFARCFSPGVIKIDPRTKAVSVDPQGVRGESMSREVFRHPEFEGCVKLGRVRDWFLFNVESESAYAPENIFPAAIRIMRRKIDVLKKAAEALLAGEESEEPPRETDENKDAPAADVVMMDV